MLRKSGAHRPTRKTLPTTATNASMAANANHAAMRRRHPSGSASGGGSIKVLAILAMFASFAVLGIFVKLTPAKVSIMTSSKSAKGGGAACPRGNERTWHGGHPAEDRPGSCWCGEDGYCMCTPSVAIDIVLYSKSEADEYSVWAVRRGDTGQLATIGGFVNVGETTEGAVLREAEEETGIVIPPEEAGSAMKLIGVYSDPRRDNRRSIVSVAYSLEFDPETMTTRSGSGVPTAGSDAKEVVSIPLDEVGKKYKGDDWYADHATILFDFKERMAGERGSVIRSGEIYEDVAHSTCL